MGLRGGRKLARPHPDRTGGGPTDHHLIARGREAHMPTGPMSGGRKPKGHTNKGPTARKAPNTAGGTTARP